MNTTLIYQHPVHRIPKAYRKVKSHDQAVVHSTCCDTFSLLSFNSQTTTLSYIPGAIGSTAGRLMSRFGEWALAPVEDIIIRRDFNQLLRFIENCTSSDLEMAGVHFNYGLLRSRIVEASRSIYPENIRLKAHIIFERFELAPLPIKLFGSQPEIFFFVSEHLEYLSATHNFAELSHILQTRTLFSNVPLIGWLTHAEDFYCHALSAENSDVDRRFINITRHLPYEILLSRIKATRDNYYIQFFYWQQLDWFFFRQDNSELMRLSKEINCGDEIFCCLLECILLKGYYYTGLRSFWKQVLLIFLPVMKNARDLFIRVCKTHGLQVSTAACILLEEYWDHYILLEGLIPPLHVLEDELGIDSSDPSKSNYSKLVAILLAEDEYSYTEQC